MDGPLVSGATTISDPSTPAYIHLLPNEIIAEIALLVQAFNAGDTCSDVDDEPWYRLLWVCQLWSTVIRSRPVFWSTVRIQGGSFNRAFLRTSVAYSGDAPLSVSISSTSPDETAFAVELLLPHVSRICSLELCGMLDTQDKYVKTLLHQNMLILRKLTAQFKTKNRLRGPYENPMYEYAIEHAVEPLFAWNLDAARYPMLTELRIRSAVSLQGRLPSVPGLKLLELANCTTAPMTVPEFGQYLSAHPKLEELSISHYRPALVDIAAPMALPAALRTFTLDDNLHYAAAFLSSFRFPPHVDLHITRSLDFFDFGDVDGSNLGGRAFSVLRALPTDTRIPLPILTAVSSIEFEHQWEEHYTLIGRTPAGHTVRLTGLIHEPGMHEHLENFSDLACAFRGAPVVRLFVNGNSSTRVTAEHWETTLEAFPLVEEIKIVDTGSFSTFDARVSLLAALLPDSASPPTIPAQTLKALIMSSEDHNEEDEELSDVLADCLKTRKEHGCGIERLRLVLRYMCAPADEDSVAEENAERVALYTKELEGLVDKLAVDVVNHFYSY
ncbi:hypothetical protein C2E23DRAFT_741090 [Lenzites betulinus]|nr:hypothetical protein C2E23DRAFT_741090 [Lenzites betulinus]